MLVKGRARGVALVQQLLLLQLRCLRRLGLLEVQLLQLPVLLVEGLRAQPALPVHLVAASKA